ncbi:MAG: peroxidase-related enzyme [Thermoplasmatota archaeon]
MPNIRVIEPPDATGALAEAYAHIQGERGAVANIVSIHSLNPDAMRTMMDFYVAVMFGRSKLTRRERELVATVVSRANGCEYCVAHHADALGRHVKEPGLVPLVAVDYTKAKLPPRERAMCDYAVNLTRAPQKTGAKDVEQLRLAGLDDSEVLDVTAVVGYFNYINRIANALGVRPDDVARSYSY